MKVKVIFYKSIEENPEEPLNYCILQKNEFDYEFDKSTLIKNFLFDIFNKYCYKCSYDDICVEMVTFLKKEYEDRFILGSKKLDAKLIDVFKYRIRKNKPLIMIDNPEYMGGGCWGESNGLKYYINSNESIHTYEPHVHVQTHSKQFKDRFNIIECKIMESKDNKKPLSDSLRKKAIKFIKDKQIYFLEIWNEHTNCSKMVI